MFGLVAFAKLSYSASNLTWNWITQPYWIYGDVSDFDVYYNNVPTTYSNSGYRPIFNVDLGKNITILGKNGGKAFYNDILVETKFSQPIGENYLLIQFVCTNNGTKSHKVSLSSFTDVQIDQNDNSSINWYGGNRGLTMIDDRYTNYTLTLLVKDAYKVENVDTFWFGIFDLINTHYWDNRTDNSSLIGSDSTFSFGWLNREVKPNSSITLGVLLGVGSNLKNPPVVKVTNEVEKMYRPGKQITISGTVEDYDPGEVVSVYYNYTSTTKKFENVLVNNYSTGTGNMSDTFSFDFELTSEMENSTLTIWSVDSFGYISNIISKIITTYLPPTPQITPFETVFQTAAETPLNTPVETLHETEAQTAHETSFITPFVTSHETPFETAFATAHETPMDTPYETVVETHEETPIETVYETVFETPYETAVDTQKETPFETAHETVFETPFETALETPVETVSETQKETVFETPVITPSSTKESEEEESNSVVTKSEEQIAISVSGSTPTQTKSKFNWTPIIIGGVVAAIVAALAIICAVIKHYNDDSDDRSDNDDDQEIDFEQDIINQLEAGETLNSVVITTENPVFNEENPYDDPFANEFDDSEEY
ncbi:hypothetical protein TVAG_215840 [Trichomonas vaginalis G3]|uniref:Uncharacterized protein n=1 Tax=Trichomonas vaginalis (strain ATCC PRA-98 / G3) TaxID=412133 RepID=A2FRV3_TRIV3|nr:bifunctional inhibitor/lipid-transfer protein/seed storage 2s albumin superfamily protein family [Trichomonas vaginalis G3]EAX92358.1 hypothetical protein TVAG_215840 [Trichomonas vaginalis G3]KAI5514449.1 bifunctional inhibitor/lipid-transfer protein/seed storage 2s albumin superfamily protein family [Trichomonas vaginalis G3]|eukprot:XP_001305288.1 hypothetical protein [Trichomonas vaginalis G3]